MARIKLSDLDKIKEKVQAETNMRDGKYRVRVNVHMGTCGIAAGARNIVKAFMDAVESRGLTDVVVTTSGCAGLCSKEPMVTVEIQNQAPVKYVSLDQPKAQEIFEKHVLGGQIVEKYALAYGSERTY
jgi:NADP-reducing hydrogenase subunit HndB